MSERSQQNLRAYLQRDDVQQRIRQNIQRGRSEATVTIGRAARLFDFTENKLRDWENLGLLTPLKPTGQRQYTPEELDKLAIIKELIEEGGYTPGVIPPDIGKIWSAVSDKQKGVVWTESRDEISLPHVDKFVDTTYAEHAWGYFASRALRLALSLICQDVPDTIAGLVLPVREIDAYPPVHQTKDLSNVGESLVGWLGWRSFSTFLTSTPSFEYSSDFRVLPLQEMKDDVPQGDTPKRCTWIVIQRKAALLTLTKPVVDTIQRLLALLYADIQKWRSSFGPGTRDWLYPITDFASNPNLTDEVLNGLADIVVQLGGKTVEGQDRWRFCCILLPREKDLVRPLQQRTLVVRAQSRHSPHKLGLAAVAPDKNPNSLSLEAYQSGHVIYRSKISAGDTTVAHRDMEEPIRSAVAVPVGGENGKALAVLYVISDEENAFCEGEQIVLRLVGRIVEELLLMYQARHQVTEGLQNVIKKPGVVDTFFEDFLSENELVNDVEALLHTIKTRMEVLKEQTREPVVSFIAIDVDNQSLLADKYGDRMMRNLSKTIGTRLQEQHHLLFSEYPDCHLYHIHADRFYVMIKGMSLEQATERAERLRQALKGPYQIDPLRPSMKETTRSESMQTLPEVTVRLGVTSYPYTKLEEILQRYPTEDAEIEVRGIITLWLNKGLERGKIAGGNVVFAWNPDRTIWDFTRWTPPLDA